MNDNLLVELRQPFLPSQITWQVGQISQDQSRAQAQATVALRAYLNRLDEVCGLAWSVTVRRGRMPTGRALFAI